MMDNQKTLEVACFDVNEHGRILFGNKRFCRMFGFAEDEVTWHYMTDLYRHPEDWASYKANVNGAEAKFTVKLRNRKGRSFECHISRVPEMDGEGRLVYHNTVYKTSEAKNVNPVVAVAAHSIVFLAKCAHCGCQIPVHNAAEAHMRMLCDECAATAYPEAFKMKAAHS